MQSHGPDVPRVAFITAERTIERIPDTFPSSVKGQLLDLANAAQEPAEDAARVVDRVDGR